MMQLRKLIVISMLALALVPGTARAQGWFVAPFIGANFGGNATFEDFDDVDDEVEKRVDFGATIGWNPSVVGEAYRDSRRPHFLGGWGLWDVQVGSRRRCVSAPSGW
jgi:hypothetical protein